MYMGDNTEGKDKGDAKLVIPENYSDPAYVEGRHYNFHLVWTEASGAPRDLWFHAETKDLAGIEACEALDACPGYSNASLGDANGELVGIRLDDVPLLPIVHYINFKERRALVCRGENAQADAKARGFKKVTSAHFHKYIADAKKGFRQKGAKRK